MTTSTAAEVNIGDTTLVFSRNWSITFATEGAHRPPPHLNKYINITTKYKRGQEIYLTVYNRQLT